MRGYLYCCYFCGKPLFKTSFVCEKCFVIPKLKTRQQGCLKHVYLFEYNKYGEVFVKNFKYGKFENVLESLACRYVSNASTVIAMPNSKNLIRENNHSYALAKKIFSEQEIFEPFYKISPKQSLLAKKDRGKIELLLLEKIDLIEPIILVDDLVTSGGTLETAWRLLGKPNASLLSLCYTPTGSKLL
ncbi:MAG: hypothetical protein KDD37_02580 [Bdellovibrionales bacterium]|nr:hypothetical protein [Bdellovibrionales bacterium]